MQKRALIPTPLVDNADRPPIVIRPSRGPSRFRSIRVVIGLLRWYLSSLWLRWTKKHSEATSARRLRLLFEDFGGLWIKTGQLLSLRTDVFSAEMCRELSALQYQSTGFPPEVAKALVERELGGPVERWFDMWEDAPFAAASIAQVHRARLRIEGYWVAVKVQRPDVTESFDRDLDMMKRGFGLFRRFRIMPHLKWHEMIWELEQMIQEEVDYRYELSNLKRMRKSLKRHRVYVPKVFDVYCTRRVLVMELLEGVLMSDYIRTKEGDRFRVRAWLDENNVVPAKVGERLILTFFRQMLEENAFHGDLHPGNILLLRNSHIALIDFGTVGSMDKRFLAIYRQQIQAVADGDFAKAVDLMFMLTDGLPVIDLAAVKAELVRKYRSWDSRRHLQGLSYYERSIGSIGGDAARVMYEHRIIASWQFMRVSRTWSTLDASLATLLEDVDYIKILKKYFRLAGERAIDNLKQIGIRRLLASAVGAGSELVMHQTALLRRQAQVFQGVQSKVAYFIQLGARLARWAVVIVALVFAYDFMHQHHFTVLDDLHGASPALVRFVREIPPYEYELGIAGLIVLLVGLRVLRVVEKRFGRRDTLYEVSRR